MNSLILPTFIEYLEEEMATYSSILAWKIPWTEEPSGLQFMESPELDTTYGFRSYVWMPS